MPLFDNNNIQHIGISMLGALILTATSVGAAVGPARMIETSPIAYAQLETSASATVEAHG